MWAPAHHIHQSEHSFIIITNQSTVSLYLSIKAQLYNIHQLEHSLIISTNHSTASSYLIKSTNQSTALPYPQTGQTHPPVSFSVTVFRNTNIYINPLVNMAWFNMKITSSYSCCQFRTWQMKVTFSTINYLQMPKKVSF